MTLILFLFILFITYVNMSTSIVFVLFFISIWQHIINICTSCGWFKSALKGQMVIIEQKEPIA